MNMVYTDWGTLSISQSASFNMCHFDVFCPEMWNCTELNGIIYNRGNVNHFYKGESIYD